MKIDKRNPCHWWYLLLQGLWAVVGWVLRPLWANHRRKRQPRIVILYGHKLSGNLKALREEMLATATDEFLPVFLTMDKVYWRELRTTGVEAMLATRPAAALLIARAAALISDHGLHAMSFLPGHSSLKFFDVWHGIMFKGFAPEDFRVQHRYDETWVTSPLLAHFYVDVFGFHPDAVQVTGYARTDPLVRRSKSMAEARRRFDLPKEGKVLLFAPTWQRDRTGAGTYPFGIAEIKFLEALSELGERTGSTVVVRAHLNTRTKDVPKLPSIIYRPFTMYPDAEGLLLACDVLVVDWSSIVFDWLLLERPTIFLEVPIPTPRGFALGPEYRVGEVVNSLEELLASAEEALCAPTTQLSRYAKKHTEVLEDVYAGTADGHASKRCIARLRAHLRAVQA